MSTAGRRGPYAGTLERRRAIADAALALVIERGHREVTTLAVATRAGISEPGLLYHYPSKEAVLVAALARFDEQQLSILAPGEALASAPARAVAGVGRTNIVHLYASLLGEAGNAVHPAHDFFQQRWRDQRAVFARDIELLQNRGEVDGEIDPQHAAAWINAAWDGLQSHWLVDPSFDIGVELGKLIDTILPPPRADSRGRDKSRLRSSGR